MSEKITNIKNFRLSKFKKILFIDENQQNLFDKTAQKLNMEKLIVIFIPNNNNDKKSLETAKKLLQLCAIYDSIFLVKNRLDIAKLSDCDGIVLDEKGIEINIAKKFIDEDKFFGFCNDKNENKTDEFDFIIQNYTIEKLC